ncbi:uncharacterized protein MONOS_10897 [Monocercomonoides exilis]|uniref:uncharacterized protein n=1 Tax=Monocercomonoides exilis TaxID=2049356 RepID=UPI003559DB3C|nr:hypothetical protein MONOS_10897 [Monocercomonoides exilis]|eukprot:MONOS_10897.1-p1 / transcript=MONOS_10897.1 / gene=MONOS_10897 / organism=Monocercomonoides_exilis_PA203 / gene_product=unspecified product / transcript_product=unspecified product / location=Mono_scaffold00516:20188-20598(-) / protein_length=137 / sequence_SO=supercontig / SO=protein_coding / is_pseudo=false
MSFSYCHFAARSILSLASAPLLISTKLSCSSSPHHTHKSASHASSPTPQTSSPSILPHSPPTHLSQHSKTPSLPYALSPLVFPSHSTPALVSSLSFAFSFFSSSSSSSSSSSFSSSSYSPSSFSSSSSSSISSSPS